LSSAYEKLARPIQKWVRNEGWRELRDIQARATNIICGSKQDLIISAPTAGGKTEAAFLPLISNVLEKTDEDGGFDLLYIGPLKALITDQARRLEDICLDINLPVVPWHGDVSASVKSRALKSPQGILMITPESLEALFIKRGLEISRLFGATQAVVIDELHSVLDSERGVQMRSLLTRLELCLGRPIQRIGLSATLGDMELARGYLRPDNPENVILVEERGGDAELKLQLRGYVVGDHEDRGPATTDVIAQHLFENLRGSDNLVFAGSRQSVEIFADKLRLLCEETHLPQEFHPHHASLSRDHRSFVEERLKDDNKPTTAVCTSTLELGIDIGDIACVAQISAPFTVTSLRQRLGRSGRRESQPAVLRQYAMEAKLDKRSNISDRLRLRLVRSVAMIELLLCKWCEPPQTGALHLSTLVHQVLSVIAERGGVSARAIFEILCTKGPFRSVTSEMFQNVLRAIGDPDTALIEQTDNGLLLLGAVGERLVEHYSFYAVFQTPEEYRLIANGRELGTLPIDNMMAPGMLLIFSGRRWVITEVDDSDRVILVQPAKAGIPPRFGGDPGQIHDCVVKKMFEIFEGQTQPVYLDETARSLLDEARANYARLDFDPGRIAQLSDKTILLATQCGTIKTTTLALALQAKGFEVQIHDGFLEVEENVKLPNVLSILATIADGQDVFLFENEPSLLFEKFHPYLTPELLQADALSSRLDQACLTRLSAELLG